MLYEVGISLELANDGNKNSNCVVNKIIDELEAELRKISPDSSKLTSSQLARALLLLNSKIRNRGLSAAEIHFARDSHDHQNLQHNDRELRCQQENLRLKNHPYLSKSRAPNGKSQLPPVLRPGDIVFKKNEITKHTERDPFVVMDSSSQRPVIRKALHSSPFSIGRPTLSTNTQSIDKKFLMKPLSSSRTYIRPFPSRESPCNSQQVGSRPKPQRVAWNPTLDSVSEPILINLDEHALSHHSCYDELQGADDSLNHSIPDIPNRTNDSNSSSMSGQYSDLEEEEENLQNENIHEEQMIFDDDEDILETPEQLLKGRKLKKGDLTSFFHAERSCRINAKITRDLLRKRRYYYNVVYDDDTEDCLYLKKDTRWTFKNTSDQNVELPRSPENSCSLKLTLETTPTQSYNVLDEANLSINKLDDSDSPSLNWDLLGTQLDSSPNPSENPFGWFTPSDSDHLNQVINLAYMLPLTSTPTRPGATTCDTGRNIDLNLNISITSTPPSTDQNSRSLPLELSQSTHYGSAFFKKLNPVKKKEH